MSSVNDHDIHLKELYENSVGKLLMSEFFDKAAFDTLYQHLESKAELLKKEYIVSKQIISVILNASSIIRSTSRHVKGSKQNIALADKFENLLELICKNETPSDRQPNVPRII